MRVRLSVRAARDLDQIFNHLHPRNPAAALRIVDELQHRCTSLSQHPERGLLPRRRRSATVRRLIESGYVILYELTEDAVVIPAVFHGARHVHAALRQGGRRNPKP
jgi:plasmid stabilization system protein ParE